MSAAAVAMADGSTREVLAENGATAAAVAATATATTVAALVDTTSAASEQVAVAPPTMPSQNVSTSSQLAPETFAASTREVLSDLVYERGLCDWRVVHGEEATIFGRARVEHFDETRASRKRKLPVRRELAAARGESGGDDDGEDDGTAVWCCFLVVPTTGGRQLSVRRLEELQQRALTLLAPEGTRRCERTFLCLTDAANVSYYHLTRDPLGPLQFSR